MGAEGRKGKRAGLRLEHGKGTGWIKLDA
eukprot:COSAG02_NODE_47745_length_339_cov_0.529167_2_plen_28_part_01